MSCGDFIGYLEEYILHITCAIMALTAIFLFAKHYLEKDFLWFIEFRMDLLESTLEYLYQNFFALEHGSFAQWHECYKKNKDNRNWKRVCKTIKMMLKLAETREEKDTLITIVRPSDDQLFTCRQAEYLNLPDKETILKRLTCESCKPT